MNMLQEMFYYNHTRENCIFFHFAIFDELIGVPRRVHLFQQALLTVF